MLGWDDGVEFSVLSLFVLSYVLLFVVLVVLLG